MKHLSIIISLGLLLLLTVSSCEKTELPKDYTETDRKIIQNYISEHNLDADSTSSGLYYVIDKPGSGKNPNIYSSVKIRYKGYLVSGIIFDESTSGITLNLNNVISGWQEGIPFFKEGGEGMLLIPSRLGYGNQATGKIPANSVTIFEIKLDEVY